MSKSSQRKNRTLEFFEGNGMPMKSRKVLPNDPCPCKSGKKAKHCCGAKTEYFRIVKPDPTLRELDKFKPAEK